ncbi:MAG TPA: hypothetical protein VM282_02080, partial [Acidimicrobiales bacterium]|nr:hypothetical protein [Acidimicrobiales bacterium]
MYLRIGSSIFRAHATRRVLAGVAILAVATSLLVTGIAPAAAVISGAGTFTYEQGDPALDIGDGISVAGGTSYGGQFLEFAVNSATATETLSLVSVLSVDTTSGVVSIVSGDVFLGNGVSADQIGSIDATDDGGVGRTLRVDFADEFVNPGFEDGLFGWTVMNQRIDLGTDNIAGCATIDTSTYPGLSTNDDNAPFDGGVPIVTVETTGSPTEGTHAVQLKADPMFVDADGDVVHGPATFSSAFELDAGAKIAFDWRGIAGIDDYHVFGYLLGSACNQIEVLDATGDTTSVWTTSETTVLLADTYRIVFVNGTFDAELGKAAGASLLVDNIRAEGPTVTDDVVQQIARKLQYFNS